MSFHYVWLVGEVGDSDPPAILDTIFGGGQQHLLMAQCYKSPENAQCFLGLNKRQLRRVFRKRNKYFYIYCIRIEYYAFLKERCGTYLLLLYIY